MKKQKWIIEDNHFKTLSPDKIDFHWEIAQEPDNIKCGGFLCIQNNTLYLYGSSNKYGSCSEDLLRYIYTNNNFPNYLANYIWKFSKKYLLINAIHDSNITNL